MRKRLFEIIETAQADDRMSNIYDIFMMVTIFISMIPLAFKEENLVFFFMDKFAMVIFLMDYGMRLATADYKLQRGKLSFLLYPITPMAIIDLLCIMPSLYLISNTFKVFKVFRLLRTLRVFRLIKAVRYSKSLRMIKTVFRRQRRALLTVALIAVAYILISALVVFNIEPDTFKNYIEAIYWATVSLTTMGYGDISPVTTIGRMVTVVSALAGIAVIAMPSGIITAGFMEALYHDSEEEKAENSKKEENETE